MSATATWHHLIWCPSFELAWKVADELWATYKIESRAESRSVYSVPRFYVVASLPDEDVLWAHQMAAREVERLNQGRLVPFTTETPVWSSPRVACINTVDWQPAGTKRVHLGLDYSCNDKWGTVELLEPTEDTYTWLVDSWTVHFDGYPGGTQWIDMGGLTVGDDELLVAGQLLEREDLPHLVAKIRVRVSAVCPE